ncbi:hypothetical protein RUM44_006214 [Polyplax serrata]|uniref:Uncharacterized protein n=1 Tax=Polyplax serrata TaxID=468196 RepID=A0ABR1AHJ0_POLSC
MDTSGPGEERRGMSSPSLEKPPGQTKNMSDRELSPSGEGPLSPPETKPGKSARGEPRGGSPPLTSS